MRKPLVLAAAFGLVASSALAADLPAPETYTSEPPMVTSTGPNDWSGFYLGAMLGYSTGESDTSVGNVDVDGVDGGIYAGYQRQFDQFVVGVEADALASGLDGNDYGISVEQNWTGSLRGRAGIALDRFLLYTTGGVALSDVKAKAGGVSDSDTRVGWTLGAGAEAAITKNLTAGVEYRYTDYEDKTFSLTAPTSVDLDTHSVRARVGYKF